MRSVTVVCDNHPDRPAVATYFGVRLAVGTRFLMPGVAGLGATYVDLCSECATVLGWRPPEPEPEVHAYEPDEHISDAQRRLLFARCREIGLDDDERHELLDAHAGDPSVRNLLAKDFDRVMVALDMEADRRADPNVCTICEEELDGTEFQRDLEGAGAHLDCLETLEEEDDE